MTAGMAEVIASVLAAEEPRGNDIRRWPKDEADAYRDAGGFMMGNEAARALQVSKLAAHIAEELTKAGYGNIPDALREAANEWIAGDWAAAFMAVDDDAVVSQASANWLRQRARLLDTAAANLTAGRLPDGAGS